MAGFGASGQVDCRGSGLRNTGWKPVILFLRPSAGDGWGFLIESPEKHCILPFFFGPYRVLLTKQAVNLRGGSRKPFTSEPVGIR